MKFIQILLAIFLLLSSTYANKNKGVTLQDNKYKDDRTVTHSLFRERNDIERISSEFTGIPPLKDK